MKLTEEGKLLGVDLYSPSVWKTTRDRLVILSKDRKLGSEVDFLPKNEVHTMFSIFL